MIFCTSEQCALCLLVAGSGHCLRRQAHKCLRLSKKVCSRAVHDTLEELSVMLMDEARAVENELTVPPAGAV